MTVFSHWKDWPLHPLLLLCALAGVPSSERCGVWESCGRPWQFQTGIFTWHNTGHLVGLAGLTLARFQLARAGHQVAMPTKSSSPPFCAFQRTEIATRSLPTVKGQLFKTGPSHRGGQPCFTLVTASLLPGDQAQRQPHAKRSQASNDIFGYTVYTQVSFMAVSWSALFLIISWWEAWVPCCLL